MGGTVWMDDAEDRREMAEHVDIILENGKGGCHKGAGDLEEQSGKEKRRKGKVVESRKGTGGGQTGNRAAKGPAAP